jgi:hypothetical protein
MTATECSLQVSVIEKLNSKNPVIGLGIHKNLFNKSIYTTGTMITPIEKRNCIALLQVSDITDQCYANSIDKLFVILAENKNMQNYKPYLPYSLIIQDDQHVSLPIQNLIIQTYANSIQLAGGTVKTRVPYEKRTVAELKSIARTRNIKNVSTLKKAEIIAALRKRK